MNKYKLFFTCAASLLLMSSCYDLDRYPEDQLSAGTFFQTQEHADQAMMGVYSQMTHNDVFGRQFGFYHEKIFILIVFASGYVG